MIEKGITVGGKPLKDHLEALDHYEDLFNDGNGRTAWLLMNLILIRGGSPSVAVRPEDRLDYIRSLQEEQAGQGAESFNAF